MVIWIYALISVVIVSLVSLIGLVFLGINKEKLGKLLFLFVSFAAGGLFGDAFIHLLPEAFEKTGSSVMVSMSVLSGIVLFFILEKIVRWRHCHLSDCKDHAPPVAAMNLMGDTAHNFIDGLIIGASYNVSIHLGITTTLAVLLHEIPQEIGDFGVLIHGGYSVRKALLCNFVTALTAVFGAIIALALGSQVEAFSLIMLPVTAGGFIYIAGSDLIPELQHEVDLSVSIKQLIFIVLGIAVMALLLLGEPR